MTRTNKSDFALDITAETCPMTYVRTRLALERLHPGQILEVKLLGDEPARMVPQSAARQGHDVIAQESLPDGTVRLLIRRA